jgi:nitrite reductase/ring-hydroxylating ferredoxin subunit
LQSNDTIPVSEVRPDFVPKTHYTSDEITRLEGKRLWPCVWQVAGRVEELARVGDFLRYDVADQSVLVVRSDADTLSGFHNVCPHRGNQLLTACTGRINRIHCSFHGWQFDLNGRNTRIKDYDDWAGYPDFRPENLGLSRVKVGVWGGFVFINMDPGAEPIDAFLDPVARHVDCVELDRMRFKRRVAVRLRANWKTAITSFMESYHVYTTHPQLKMFVDDISVSRARGKHGNHGYPNARPFGAPSARTGLPVPDDIREGYVRALGGMSPPEERNGVTSDRSAEASLRILNEVPPGTPPHEVHRLGMQFMREAAEAEGAGWPNVTPEQAAELGIVWNVFPNLSLSLGLDAALVIRARPDTLATGSCLFDVWLLERFGPGKEPEPKPEFFADWNACEGKLPTLLLQDMRNIERVQRGMNSIGFKGSRTNPVQEVQVSNLHRVLHHYLYERCVLG